MNDDLISVIVPVYNAHEYLDKCLSSIVNQEYENLEIILVNDGSTDDSPEICRAFAEKDSRIKFYSKENGGQASARNYALDRMTGKYVTFIDSDDWVTPNYCRELHRLAADNEADITGCVEFHDGEEADPYRKYNAVSYTMQEYAEILIPDEVTSHLISRLFLADLFGNNTQWGGGIRFPKRVVEDMGIFPLLLRRAKKVVMSDSPLYFYRSNPQGVSSTTDKNPSGPMDRALIFIERYSMAEDWVPDTMPLILKKAVWFGISSYTWLNKYNAQKYSEGYSIIQKFFVDHKDEIAASPLIDKPRKLAAKLIISGNTLPFRLTSWLRPTAKRVINMLQGTAKTK